MQDLELVRRRLEAKIELFGLADKRTIKTSQKLDELIVDYYKRKNSVCLLKLNKLDLRKFTLKDEVCKLSEEHHEFQRAVVANDRENMIEEFFDIIQAAMGVVEKVGITDIELKLGLKRHNQKLLSRGWKFDDSCRWC